jgi:hypothetical protein
MNRSILLLAVLSFLCQGVVASETASKPSKVLYGRIDAIGDMCSSAGVTLSSRKMPTTVESIRPGSSASYSGLEEGDKVLSGNIEDNRVSLLIERKGKQYAVKLNTMYNPLKAEVGKEGKTKSDSLKGAAQQEATSLSELAKYDIVLVVDRSGSMNEPVDGGGLTKWKWCSDNISEFTNKIKPYLTGEGIELVTFGMTYTVQKNCSPESVNGLFSKESPQGNTDLASPLKALFDQHFSSSSKKPMLIAVLTDGMPNRGAFLNDVIIDATKKMRYPDEIRIVFMQIGNEFEGRALLETLDNYLVHNGAAYDIVDSVAFGNMRQGILDPLVITIRHDWHPVTKHGPESTVPEPVHTESTYKIEPPPRKPSEP